MTRDETTGPPERQEPRDSSALPEPTLEGLTPYQPTGPYPQVMLDLPTGTAAPLPAGGRGERITLEGRVLDGAGTPLGDVMVETWQADADGVYHHPADPRTAAGDDIFWGYARVATDRDGRFTIDTVKPGAVRSPDGAIHAPHIRVTLFGGGILYRYVTRIYFEGEAANATDPVLALVPEPRRPTLIARRDGNRILFAIRLQGENETVFFDV